ncbi:Uncharacterized protein Adt_24596 [Abeliophyllum distichum]|uniref:RNase H type-1 domain-containing protein n=1 Tax=Abeliophyllum distichum TaxID=126358 RepID=A0ABD1SEG6_9LAMI
MAAAREGANSNLLLLFICWFLWLERNEAKQRGDRMNITGVIWNVKNLLHNLKRARLFTRDAWNGCKKVAEELEIVVQRRSKPKSIIVQWLKPKGGGGTIRDEHGRLCLAYCEKYGVATSIEAELFELRTGLKLCKERDITSVWAEVDSQTALELLTEGSRGPWWNTYLQ